MDQDTEDAAWDQIMQEVRQYQELLKLDPAYEIWLDKIEKMMDDEEREDEQL